MAATTIRDALAAGARGDVGGRWEQILQAALALFHARGYHATTMQDVADAVGLQKGSLYHYIRSKEELLFPLVERALAGFLEDLQRERASGGSAREMFERIVTAHVERVSTCGDLVSVFVSEARHLQPEEQARVHELTARYRRGLEEVLEQGVARGEFADCDVAMVTLAVVGACNWLPQWYRPGGRLDSPAIGRQFVRLFLDGLALPEQPAGP